MNLKELTKLINAGYPLYMGIGCLILGIYNLTRLAIKLLNGSSLSGEMLAGLLVFLALMFGFGILLINSIEAKKE